jgi:HlyD family secretion protein
MIDYSLGGRWRLLILVFAIFALLATGGGWYYYTQYLPVQATNGEETIQTARVRQGNLVIGASGSGTLLPAQEVDLGFSSGGLLSEMLVEVGDWVEKGAVLARIDPTALERAVTQAEADLMVAQDNLDGAENPYTQLDRNQAYLAADQAAAALTEARENLVAATEPSACFYESVVDLEYEYSWYHYNYVQTAELYEAGEIDREEMDAARDNLQWAEERLDEALECPPGPEDVAVCENDYTWYQGRFAEMGERYEAGEISQEELFALWDRLQAVKQRLDQARQAASEANKAEDQVAEAEYNLQKGQETLTEIQAGPDPTQVETARAKLLSAQAALEDAQAALEGTTIVAPFAGVVTAVEAQAGDMVGTASIITLASLDHPLIEIYLDETDLDKVAVGYEVEVLFDALPDQTFIGHVVRVVPELLTVQGVPTVLVYASLEEEFDSSSLLPIGSNASAEIIAARAENAILVPVEALRELSPGNYAVFVMVDGELQPRPVEVGLMDYAYVEIISGLQLGDEVSTGIVETE